MEDLSVILGAQVNVKVHPVVIFNILDQYVRRAEKQERVIGTLLGTYSDGTIEIKNSFPVPHTEVDQVAVDMEFHRNMYELHQKTAPKEVIVGWYATGLDINENSVMIHEFYGKETNVPTVGHVVHLLVDTTFSQDTTMGLRAYIGTPVTFGDKQLGSYFQPVPLEIRSLDIDRVGLDLISRTRQTTSGVSEFSSDLLNLEGSISTLASLLDSVSEYVEKVANGTIPADPAIGRFLSKAVSALPTFEAEIIDKIFNNSIQDLLMVVYLGNLTRTQIALAEKLQKAL
jgi:translation initiation factor 3 subunit F